MSKTVSFVARDELAEWLESQADAEMKTVSAVCQEIVAREYRRQSENERNPARLSETHSAQSEANLAQSETDSASSSFEQVLEAYPEKWYEPDGARDYAVHEPEGKFMADGPRYFTTKQGAAEAILRWYDDS